MKASKTALDVGIALACALLLPARLSPQMPPRPAKLVIKSEPTGAAITINGNAMDHPTDASFLVTPGTYKVAVAGQDGKPRCPETPVPVRAGQTATCLCSSAGWKIAFN